MGVYLQVRRKPAPTSSPDSGVRRVLPPAVAPPRRLVPRLHDESESETTRVSEEVAQLALLSDLSSVPWLVRPVDFPMTHAEAYLTSLLRTGFDLATLLDMSPLAHDDTFRFLARLVTMGAVNVRRDDGRR
jgi:hypothetical protein